MEGQALEAFNAEIANNLRAFNSGQDVTSESSTENDESDSGNTDITADPSESSPEETLEDPSGEDQSNQIENKEEFTGDPSSKANQRIRQLLTEKKSFEEKVTQSEAKVAAYEKQLQEVQAFAEQNRELLDLAEVLAKNPDLLSQFKAFVERSPENNSEPVADPYAGLPPALIKELEENKRARSVLQQIQEREQQRESELQHRNHIDQITKKVSAMDAQFQQLCTAAKLVGDEEKEFLTQQIFLDAMQEVTPELYQKVFMEVMGKLPDNYLESAFKKRSAGIFKLRSAVKKSLSVPVVPASSSKTGVPAIQTKFSSTKEMNDAIAMELKKSRA